MPASEQSDRRPDDDALPIQLRDILKRAGRNTGMYLLVRFLPALTSLVTVPVFTRMIAPAEYGDLYLVLAASAFLAHVAVTWLSQSAIRFFWVSHREQGMSRFTATTVWSAVASLGLVSAVVLLATQVGRGVASDGILALVPVAVASFFVNRLVVVLLEILKAGNRARDFAGISLLSTVAGTITSLALVWYFDTGAWGILAGNLIGFAITLPWALVRVRAIGSLSPGDFSGVQVRQYLTYGMPMMLAGLSYWLLVLSDRYIIGVLRGTYEAGLYSVTYGLGEKLLQLLTLPLTMTMVPLMMEAFEKHGVSMAGRMQTSFTRYYLLLTLPLLLGVTALNEVFLQVFADSDYWEAAHVLPLVAAGTLLYGMSEIGNVGIALHKRSTISMSNTAIAAGANIAANLVLVPLYGYTAAAYTTVGAYGVLLSLTWLRARPYMRWNLPWAGLGRIAVASAGMYGVILSVQWMPTGAVTRLLLGFVAGIASYALLITITGAVSRGEWKYVVDTVRGLTRGSRSSRRR